jgi:2-iminobutanoate/2-iminopropanoate deaminase
MQVCIESTKHLQCPTETILTSERHRENKRGKMKKPILTPNAPKPIGPYSQAVQAGKFLFISGQLAIDPKEGKLIVEDVELQTRQVMLNIKGVLEAAGYSLKDIVQSTVYLSSMELFEKFNSEYSKFFNGEFPARATVACELKAGALVEVSVVAYKD